MTHPHKTIQSGDATCNHPQCHEKVFFFYDIRESICGNGKSYIGCGKPFCDLHLLWADDPGGFSADPADPFSEGDWIQLCQICERDADADEL